MTDAEKLKLFLESYKDHVIHILEPTRKEVKIAFKKWKDPTYWQLYSKKSRLPSPSPIQRVFSRIKRPESTADKIFRKPNDYPNGLAPESFQNMKDTLGARAIVYFMSQLPLIDLDLRNSANFEISNDSPPVAYLSSDLTSRYGLDHLRREDKDSGYASVHYILRLRDSSLPLDKRPWFELQVRTLAEDLWGEVEHIIAYKPDKRTSFAVKKQFYILGKELSAIDEHFNLLYEELLRFQTEGTVRDSDPLNAENLPLVLSELSIGCAQNEIDGLLKLLSSRHITNVSALRNLATIKRLEFVRNTFISEKGRIPANFEVVATLAMLALAKGEEQELDLIKTQISFLDAWDSLQKGFS